MSAYVWVLGREGGEVKASSHWIPSSAMMASKHLNQGWRFSLKKEASDTNSTARISWGSKFTYSPKMFWVPICHSWGHKESDNELLNSWTITMSLTTSEEQNIISILGLEWTDAKAEAPILWLPNMNSQLIGKDPDTRKDWGQEEKGATEDEMVG